MPTPVIQPSFGSGEISPSLWGRVDLAKYRIGAAKLRNFFVDYKGGATSRPGMEFVGKAYKSDYPVRLISFQFNTEQTYVLEFGHLYIRVIKDGGYVLEAAKNITGITQANPGVVTSNSHGFANGDWIYISGVGGMTQLNGNTYEVANVTANTFTLKSIYSGLAVDTTSYGAYTAGGTASRYYTITTPYFGTDLALLKFAQSADVLTITHPDYEVGDLTRTAHDNWTLTAVTFGSTIATPTGVTLASVSGAGVNYSYQVTAVTADNEESIPSIQVSVGGADYTTTTNTITVSWNRVVGAQYYNVYRAPLGRGAPVPVGAQHGLSGSTFGNQFADSNIQPDYTITPPINYNPFANGAIIDYNIVAPGAGYVAGSTTISVTDPNGTGASLLPVIVGGAVVGVIIRSPGKNYTSPSVTVTGAGAGASITLSMSPLVGNNPSVTCYFQQRKWYAAPANYPETVYASKPGAYKNFDYSQPINSGDSIENVLASQQVNDVRWLVPMQGGLVVLTGAGAWQISGGSDGAPITATGIKAEPQAFNGCANQVQPLVVGYDILYVQSKGSVVRDLSYNFFVNVYTGTDLSLLSNHLFAPYSIVEWTWAEEPHKLVWAVRDDGKLLSCAFLKEQEVVAWSPHDTQGLAKSVTTIQEGIQDVVYLVVERLIGGQMVKYIEKFTSRVIDLQQQIIAMDSNEPWRYNTFVEDAFCVDSGLRNVLTGRGGTLSASSISGPVTLTNSTPVFTLGDVGSVIRCMKGIIDVTGYTSSTIVTGNWRMYPTEVYPETGVPIPSTDWTIQAPFTNITGLNHLEGQTVQILGDGNVFPPKVVTNGAVAVNQPITRVVVGLKFTAQLQTLDLELESPPKTIQGKRKKLSQMTVKVAATRGIAYGPSFDQLAEVKDRTFGVPLGMPIPLLTGQFTVNNAPQWDVQGRVCLEQAYPLPASILAIAPDVDVGD